METTGVAVANRFAVILPAAGRSRRFRDADRSGVSPSNDPETASGGAAAVKKVYAGLLGRPVWGWAAECFASRGDVARILLVISAEDGEIFRRQRDALVAAGHESLRRVETVHGGDERVDSVRNALRRLNEPAPGGISGIVPEFGWVAIHDAARPCVTPEMIDRLFAAAVEYGAAIPAVRIAATLKRTGGHPSIVGKTPGAEWIGATVSRDELREAQTPQVFRRTDFEAAYAEFESIFADGETPTDDARLMERRGRPVAMVRGVATNLKITTAEDLHLAEAILSFHRTGLRKDA